MRLGEQLVQLGEKLQSPNTDRDSVVLASVRILGTDLPDGHDIVRRLPATAQDRSGGDRRRLRRQPERHPMSGPEITFEAGEDAPGGSHPRGAHPRRALPRRFAKRRRVASTTAFERPASARTAGPRSGEADGGEG
ncbi:MAG: hypothetical protein OXH99_16505 [Bryobacterales bacterium]|nr:hypothetical protein [Bryobacterales bacterium]